MQCLEAPPPLFQDPAAAGERLVARIRLVAVGVIAAMQLAPGADRRADQATILLLLLALAAAAAFYVLLLRRYEPWIAFASSAGDVTFVTLGLLSLALVGKPHAAANSLSIFEIYFLVLGWAAPPPPPPGGRPPPRPTASRSSRSTSSSSAGPPCATTLGCASSRARSRSGSTAR